MLACPIPRGSRDIKVFKDSLNPPSYLAPTTAYKWDNLLHEENLELSDVEEVPVCARGGCGALLDLEGVEVRLHHREGEAGPHLRIGLGRPSRVHDVLALRDKIGK